MNRTAIAVLVACLAATSLAVSGEETSEDPHVMYRHVIFEGMAKHMKAASLIVKGVIDRKGDLEGHAAAIHSNAMTIAGLFPESSKGKTEDALPAIWDKPDEFSKAAKLLVDESGKLVEIAKTKDFPAYQAQFGKVGQACGNCHETFRKDDLVLGLLLCSLLASAVADDGWGSSDGWDEPAATAEALPEPRPDPTAPPGDPQRGLVLAGLAGCIACHTAEGAPSMSGGAGLTTEVGTFYGSNLTQSPTAGLGDWAWADFEQAMRVGKAPDGRPYVPVFPYPSFTHATDRDLADLWAWLRTVPAVDTPNRPQEPAPRARSRTAIGLWRLLYFRRGTPPDQAALSDPLILGENLVEGLGHCGACHTPRNANGAPRPRWHLAGTDQPPEPAPNLTPHPDGLGAWTEGDLTTFLQLGMLPDGDFVGGEMSRVVLDGTAQLTEAERAAIAAYLRTAVTPRPDR